MAWCAKPYLGYARSDPEFTENVLAINGFLNERGYTLESQAGLIACMYHESGLNPWRWGGDYDGHEAMEGDPNQSAQGYGFFQFTPWGKYVDNQDAELLEGYAPNKSIHEITEGADPSDGWAQMLFYDLIPGWVADMWRDYWYAGNPLCYEYGLEPLTDEEVAEYQGYRDDVIFRWGINGVVPKSEFKNMTYIEDAVWAFLSGYEGPLVPRYYGDACEFAREVVWEILSSDTPPDPPDSMSSRKGMPLWMYLRRY